jgi:hypothetical protein
MQKENQKISSSPPKQVVSKKPQAPEFGEFENE